MTASSLLFTAGLGGCGGAAVEAWKAPRALAQSLPADQVLRDVRVATYAYFRPSLIFYCRRQISTLGSEQQVLDFLGEPLPSYLIVPADLWAALEPKLRGPHHLIAKRRDLYQNCDVVVVTNEQENPAR